MLMFFKNFLTLMVCTKALDIKISIKKSEKLQMKRYPQNAFQFYYVLQYLTLLAFRYLVIPEF